MRKKESFSVEVVGEMGNELVLVFIQKMYYDELGVEIVLKHQIIDYGSLKYFICKFEDILNDIDHERDDVWLYHLGFTSVIRNQNVQIDKELRKYFYIGVIKGLNMWIAQENEK